MPTLRLFAVVAVLVPPALVACREGGAAPDDAPATDGGGDGVVVLPDGAVIEAPGPCNEDLLSDSHCRSVAADSCAPGTMARLGSRTCAPVGVPRCADGLVRDATGFGCAAKVPADCPANARRTFAGCVSLPPCSAPFPPAAATLFVNDDGPVDATHKRTIGEAIAVAPAGATIAVESGTYTEVLAPTASVNLVGRCAERVVLTPPAASTAPAITVTGPIAVTATNVTLRGFARGGLADGGTLKLVTSVVRESTALGAHARNGGTLELVSSVVRATRANEAGQNGWGVAVFSGGKARVHDTTIDGNASYGIVVSGEGSSADVSRSLVVATRVPQEATVFMGASLSVGAAATARVVGSALVDSDARGVSMSDRARVELVDSVVSGARGEAAMGLAVSKGAVATVRGTTLAGHTMVGVLLNGAGSTATLETSALSAKGVSGGLGRGADAESGAQLTITKSALTDMAAGAIRVVGSVAAVRDSYVARVDARRAGGDLPDPLDGIGIDVAQDAVVEIRGTTIEEASTAAVFAYRGAVSLDGTLMRATSKPADRDYGTGLWLANGATATVRRSASDRHAGIGVLAVDEGTKLTADGLLVEGARAVSDGTMGLGIAVLDGAEAVVDDLRVAKSVATGLVVAGGRARIASGMLYANAVALHTQEGSTLVEGEGEAPLGPLELRVSSSVKLIDNQTRVGGGVLPIPRDVLPR